MSSGWVKEVEKRAKKTGEEIMAEAIQRAAYRVQQDFHTKLIDTIEQKTNHPTLSQACYCMLEMNGSDINVDIYYDASAIDGFFESFSRYHKSGSPWEPADETHGVSSYDFWSNYDEDAKVPQYGAIESEWIMKNFWDGYEWRTNGWPLPGGGEFLQTWKVRTVSAYNVAQKYFDDYAKAGHYTKYVNEEIRSLTK